MAPIAPEVASALIGAGGTTASGIANLLSFGSAAHYQRKNMRAQKELNLELMAQQNAYNKALYEQQFGDELKLWEKNRGLWYEQFNAANAYNDPAAQRARLERAGFNPYAMLGSSGMTGMSSASLSSPGSSVPSASGVSAQGVSIPPPNQMDFSFIGNAIKDGFAGAMAYAQVKEKNAQADMAASDASYRSMLNMYKLGQAKAENELTFKKILGQIHDNNYREKLAEHQEQMNRLFDETEVAQIMQIHGQAEQTARQNSLISTQKKLVDEQITNAIVERSVAQANIKLTYAKIGEVSATINNLMANVGLLNAQTKDTYIQALGHVIGNGQAAKLADTLQSQAEEELWYLKSQKYNPLYWLGFPLGAGANVTKTIK